MKQRATVVCMQKGRLLLVVNRRANWALPGGKPGSGEPLSLTAARELTEETALGAVRMNFLFRFTGRTTEHHVFEALVDDDAVVQASREIVRCEWVSPSEMARTNASPTTLAIVDRVLGATREAKARKA
jgi:8-oxo-dGTP diphosphatase